MSGRLGWATCPNREWAGAVHADVASAVHVTILNFRPAQSVEATAMELTKELERLIGSSRVDTGYFALVRDYAEKLHAAYVALRDRQRVIGIEESVVAYFPAGAPDAFSAKLPPTDSSAIHAASDAVAAREVAGPIPEIQEILADPKRRAAWRSLFGSYSLKHLLPFRPATDLSLEFYTLRVFSTVARRFGLSAATSDNKLREDHDFYTKPTDAARRSHEILHAGYLLVLGGCLKYSSLERFPAVQAVQSTEGATEDLAARRELTFLHLRNVKTRLQTLDERWDTACKNARPSIPDVFLPSQKKPRTDVEAEVAVEVSESERESADYIASMRAALLARGPPAEPLGALEAPTHDEWALLVARHEDAVSRALALPREERTVAITSAWLPSTAEESEHRIEMLEKCPRRTLALGLLTSDSESARTAVSLYRRGDIFVNDSAIALIREHMGRQTSCCYEEPEPEPEPELEPELEPEPEPEPKPELEPEVASQRIFCSLPSVEDAERAMRVRLSALLMAK